MVDGGWTACGMHRRRLGLSVLRVALQDTDKAPMNRRADIYTSTPTEQTIKRLILILLHIA